MAKRTGVPDSLYVGVTERIAKQAPVFGLNPKDGPIYLSDVYPGYFAYLSGTREDDRYGIIEVDVPLLEPDFFLPSEWFIEQTVGQRSKVSAGRSKRLDAARKSLERYQGKWKDSLARIGVIVYQAPIPKKGIRKVSIYDPQSNPLISAAIVDTKLTLKEHKERRARNKALTRWLLGEDVPPTEWAAAEGTELTTAEKEKLAEALQSKLGLDVFFYGTPPKPG